MTLASAADVEQRWKEKVSTAFRRVSAERARDPHQLSASGVGDCLRRSAYRLAGTPVTNEAVREDRAANIGTAIHDMLLPHMGDGEAAGVLIEHPVEFRAAGTVVTGRLDLFEDQAVWLDEASSTLVDVKTCGDFSWNQAKRRIIKFAHLAQAGSYAGGLIQAGRTVDWVVWVFIHRATGAVETVAMEYTHQLTIDAIDRIGQIIDASADPDSAMREGPGPSWSIGRSFSVCDGCEWLSRCWSIDMDAVAPPAAAPQAILIDEGHTTPEAVLDMYDQARRDESEARDRKSLAKAMLSGTPAGTYGRYTYRLTSIGAISVGVDSRAPQEPPCPVT